MGARGQRPGSRSQRALHHQSVITNRSRLPESVLSAARLSHRAGLLADIQEEEREDLLWSIFGLTVERSLAAKYLFHQEKSRLSQISRRLCNSENAVESTCSGVGIDSFPRCGCTFVPGLAGNCTGAILAASPCLAGLCWPFPWKRWPASIRTRTSPPRRSVFMCRTGNSWLSPNALCRLS